MRPGDGRAARRPGTVTTADDLIAAKVAPKIADPPPEAIAEIDKLLRHNDSATVWRRVGAREALALMQSHGWMYGLPAFRRWIRERYGRKSWGEK